jgi:hypothetical protein
MLFSSIYNSDLLLTWPFYFCNDLYIMLHNKRFNKDGRQTSLVRSVLVFLPFCLCVVCSSKTWVFWLPLWYLFLLSIVYIPSVLFHIRITQAAMHNGFCNWIFVCFFYLDLTPNIYFENYFVQIWNKMSFLRTYIFMCITYRCDTYVGQLDTWS